MANEFCKIHDTEHGQLVVMLAKNTEGEPEVRYFISPEGLGVCCLAVGFTDDEAGWTKADELYALSSQTQALFMVRPILDMAAEVVAEEDGDDE